MRPQRNAAENDIAGHWTVGYGHASMRPQRNAAENMESWLAILDMAELLQ